jgi:tRNA nucleotidyltransferase (CCA-adding enzyme)
MGKIKMSPTIEVIDSLKSKYANKPSVKKSTMQKEIDYVPCNCKKWQMTNGKHKKNIQRNVKSDNQYETTNN